MSNKRFNAKVASTTICDKGDGIMSTTINKDDFFNSEPIKIDSPKYGVMEFSELILKDMTWLDQEPTQKLLARDFIVYLIYNHLLNPKLDMQEVHDLGDDELSFVAVRWLRNQQEDSTLPDTASFEEIKEAVYAYYNALTGETREQINTFFTSQRKFIEDLSKTILPSLNFASSLGNLANVINLSPLVNNILLPQASFAGQLQTSVAQQLSANIPNISSLVQPLVDLGEFFQKVSASTQLISNIYNNFAASLPQLNIAPALLNTAQFFAGLPDLTELGKIWKEAIEGGEAFAKAGFSFTSDYVSFKTVQRFANISPKVRSAVITSQLAAETRKSEFEHKLKQLFEQSSVLRRRWPIISQAIKAHRRREYNISIPAILAQVEGIIGDALILNGLIASQGYKLYEKKNGKLVEVHGLGVLINRSSWQTHPALQGVADLFTTQLTGERNHILHGRKTNYGVAKLSVQGLLLLYVLATEVTVFETGKAP